jgi:hypothetical protein
MPTTEKFFPVLLKLSSLQGIVTDPKPGKTTLELAETHLTAIQYLFVICCLQFSNNIFTK